MQQESPGEVEHEDLMEENAGPLPGGVGGTPYNGPYGAQPEMGYLFLASVVYKGRDFTSY